MRWSDMRTATILTVSLLVALLLIWGMLMLPRARHRQATGETIVDMLWVPADMRILSFDEHGAPKTYVFPGAVLRAVTLLTADGVRAQLGLRPDGVVVWRAVETDTPQ